MFSCCDVRGMLGVLVLKILSCGAKSGDGIAEELGKRRGKKPTPGTIYPALKELKAVGLVAFEKKGREKIYSLTPAGRKELRRVTCTVCNIFYDFFEK